ncbi:MAG: PIG-L deacetylase family protein [Acidimicrobiales bacterium]
MSRSTRLAGRQVRRAVTWAMGRLRPVAPPGAWRAILAARSLVGRGPVVVAPAPRRALVVAPHPDDETIGCGGTLAGLAARGTDVRVVIATSGEASVAAPGAGASATAAARRAEATAACAVLGVPPPTFLGLPDGALEDHVGQLATLLATEVAGLDPQAIFVPWPLDDHPDHRAVPAALARIEVRPDVEIWGYEVWSALPANRIVDVSASWDTKVRALACHAAAHGTFDPSAHLALQRWRSLFGLDGRGHAEAFLVMGVDDLRQVLAEDR